VKEDYRALLQQKTRNTESNIGNLTVILSSFEAALAQQLSINSDLSITMQAIQEGLAQQSAFLKSIATTQEFLESVVGPDYAGQTTPPPCPQAQAFGNYLWSFPVVSQATIDAEVGDSSAATF
jgi:carbonic anhydrase